MPQGTYHAKEDKLFHWALLALLALLLLERIYVFFELGAEYMSYSDDVAYVESGIYFAHTGTVSIWWEYPTAMIMPGMPVVIGLISLLFGEGIELIIAVKMLWIVMGVLTAYVSCKAVGIFAPKWCGLFAAGCFLIPNMAWMNNVILTETPYALFLVLCIYCTLQMGERKKTSDFVLYTLSFMAALMFRTNIISMPVFTALYLLLKKGVSKKRLLKRGMVFAGVLLLFLVPWGIRNYVHFGAFIPLTYGAGNPLLLGTYQGEGYPEDDDLDYYSNVYLKMREDYADYYKEEAEITQPDDREAFAQKYDPYGDVKDLKQAQYLSLEEDGMKARYRMSEWLKKDPISFLKSYLLIKPRWMLNWSWAWMEVLSVPYSTLHLLSQINFVLCALTVILSLLLKKCRRPIAFLSFVYFANVYIHAMAFVSDRYASTLMIIRYIMIGFTAYLLMELWKKAKLQFRKN